MDSQLDSGLKRQGKETPARRLPCRWPRAQGLSAPATERWNAFEWQDVGLRVRARFSGLRISSADARTAIWGVYRMKRLLQSVLAVYATERFEAAARVNCFDFARVKDRQGDLLPS